jgi:hypothetical protein
MNGRVVILMWLKLSFSGAELRLLFCFPTQLSSFFIYISSFFSLSDLIFQSFHPISLFPTMTQLSPSQTVIAPQSLIAHIV